MSEEPEITEPAPSREWMKFIVLAVILVGVIIVMALARPLIFNRVVPAVMGEGQLTAPMSVEEPVEKGEEAYPIEASQPTAVPEIEETPAEEPYPVKEEETVAEEEMPTAEEELPTAVSTISHTVQKGDTMLNIARRYDVTVDAIIAANNISNPNHIEVGTTLLIPQP